MDLYVLSLLIVKTDLGLLTKPPASSPTLALVPAWSGYPFSGRYNIVPCAVRPKQWKLIFSQTWESEIRGQGWCQLRSLSVA